MKAWVAALLSAVTGFAHAATGATDVEVIKSEFGIFQEEGSDQLGFGASNSILLSPGQAYGWLMEVKTAKKSVAVREELSVASGATEQASESELTPAAPPAAEAVVGFNERRIPVMDGMIFGERKVNANDKPGSYQLRVFVEKKLVATFDYRLSPAVVEPSPATQTPIIPKMGAVPAKKSVQKRK